ncbi:hypothetical protein ACQ4PT_052219 [Festuca glaucescens]
MAAAVLHVLRWFPGGEAIARAKHSFLSCSDAEGGYEDRTNALHDHLLQDIVSRLPSKDAARTAALASRWRHLWRSTPLVFHDHHLLPSRDRGHGHVAAVARVLAAHPGPFRTVSIGYCDFGCHDRELGYCIVFRKPTREAAADDGDKLSKLPDDLLLNILERVDTLDAIRTCILSKRLQKLPTMLSHLFISVGSISCHHNLALEFGICDVLRISHAVAGVTGIILSRRNRAITISKLKIRFVLTDHDAVAIGRSVARTMATQKVNSAEFEMVTEKAYGNCSPDDLLHFARQFKTFISACPDAFAGLTRGHAFGCAI